MTLALVDFKVGMLVRYGNQTGEVVGIVKGLSGVPDFKCIEVEFTESVCLSNFVSSRHTFYYNETFLKTIDHAGAGRKISDLTIIEKVEEKTMTIDDFKVGMRVKHKEYGEGVVEREGEVLILIKYGADMYNFHYPDELTIIEQPISKMETTEEKAMQEFEPITKDNIEEVLKYNDSEYDSREIYDEFPAYNCPDVYTPYYISIMQQDSNRLEFYLGGIDDYEGDSITTTDFDEFLAFVEKRVELKPIPKKPKFDFKQYLLDNGFVTKEESAWVIIKNYITIWIFNNYFELLSDTKTFGKTKENADILISAAKLLEGLK